jgi:hypothetical protein
MVRQFMKIWFHAFRGPLATKILLQDRRACLQAFHKFRKTIVDTSVVVVIIIIIIIIIAAIIIVIIIAPAAEWYK